MQKSAIAIIQARMSSSRLPGKVMKPLSGKPVIWHIYKRAEKCKFIDKVIVATSTDKTDDPLVDYCRSNGLNYFRGSLNNVLSRFIEILNKNDYSYFVRITGDCPLIHPEFIDNQIMALQKFDGDVIWIPKNSSVLEGQGVHSKRSLQYIYKYSNNPDDLEHVGSIYLSNNPDKFKIVELSIPRYLDVDNIRMTVDEQKDYEFISKIYTNLWKSDPLDLKDVLAWLKKNPEVIEINKIVHHKKLNIDLINKKKKWIDISMVGYFKYKDEYLI